MESSLRPQRARCKEGELGDQFDDEGIQTRLPLEGRNLVEHGLRRIDGQ